MKRFSIALCLLLVAGMAEVSAQTPAQSRAAAPAAPRTGASAATRPAAAIAPNALYEAALRMARGIDAGQAAQLWEAASAVTKRSVTREAFVAGVSQARKPLGAVTARDWHAVRRQNSSGGSLPAGQYASVEFAAVLAGGRVAQEMISFRLDEDGVWRFAGYVAQ